MKLSEALSQRSDLNKRIAEVTQRMVDNAKVQEGTTPAEDCATLLGRLEEMASQLQRLMAQINKTNLATNLSNGKSLTDSIAERDILLVRIGYHRKLADAGVIKQSVQTRTEVRFVPQVDVTKLRETCDELSKAHRILDLQIQAANYTTEVIAD
ncbi:MAG: DIP1984 family protein [Chlorobia bacterium]|nr:DIP1984 family protein [Fimbriimonadaceae bacterium]